jgi:hypothetical protein
MTGEVGAVIENGFAINKEAHFQCPACHVLLDVWYGTLQYRPYHSETYHSETYHSETYHSETYHSETYHSETYHSETFHVQSSIELEDGWKMAALGQHKALERPMVRVEVECAFSVTLSHRQ